MKEILEEAQTYANDLHNEQFGLFDSQIRDENTVENYNEYYESVLFSDEGLRYKVELIENN